MMRPGAALIQLIDLVSSIDCVYRANGPEAQGPTRKSRVDRSFRQTYPVGSAGRFGGTSSLRFSLLWPPGCQAGTLMSLNQPADCAQDFLTRASFQSGRPGGGLAELIAEEGAERLKLRDRCLEQLPACDHQGEFSAFELHGHRAL